jgi:hypothetical protein
LNYAKLKSAYDAGFISFYYNDNIGNQVKFFNCDEDVESSSLYLVKTTHPDLFACYDLCAVINFLFNAFEDNAFNIIQESNGGSSVFFNVCPRINNSGNENCDYIEVKLSDINLKYINKMKLIYASKELYVVGFKINNSTIASEIVNMKVELHMEVEYGYSIPHK